ncbi:septal ring lytic transglycosylase RlpA family protein [Ciceribacter sp. RN22]|uniref:septal ring lytic transglycosylase RlpA family protein n=1 Tax=Ciceribacter sp. RN22 TaxID=2954932 RepID=UPI00209217C9|nr:septal ring lytic transglycosylase RlpA family protein [Ciceribacter sp. RN22]MCO6178342.1 septal ring lytic transglycosylase RlpA family protein [Ciceribacter sp. RN22]
MGFDRGGAVRSGARWIALSVLCVGVASCASTEGKKKTRHGKEYFSESEYGVKASPRVAYGGNIPKGGGRYLVGTPYVVKGKVYVPKENPNYDKVGIASWYGSAFHGRKTANGEVYDQFYLSAAHPTLPLPSYARVTNVENGNSVIVRVNDRGPFHSNRIIDLSNKTADLLDMTHSGTGKVRVQYVGPARMDGHDMPYLMASYIKKGDRFPLVDPAGQIASGVMVASADPASVPLPAPSPMALAEAPAPAIQTSLAGPTPSEAFGGQQIMPAALDSFTGFVLLPELGPVPYERPQPGLGDRASYASAYAEEPTVTVRLAFDAVMVRNDGLTEGAILASARRTAAGKASSGGAKPAR